MRRWVVGGAVLAAAVVLAGCNYAQKGGLLGAAVGATTGAVWAETSTAPVLSTLEATGVGGAVGGLTGMAVGDAIDYQEGKAAELAQRRAIENLEKQLAQANQRASELESELAEASKRTGADPEALAKARNELALAKARASELEQALAKQKAALDSRDRELSDRNRRLAEAEKMVAMRDDLLKKHQDELAASKAALKELQDKFGEGVQVERKGDTITLTFAGEVLFDSGKSEIKPSGRELLDRVARVLKENFGDNELNIEGHTDNVPIRYSGYRSNWELSAARAFAVLHYLVDQQKLNPKSLSATAYGETRPVATNDTPEGRRANRRAVIVILPKKVKFERQRLDMDHITTADARKERTP